MAYRSPHDSLEMANKDMQEKAPPGIYLVNVKEPLGNDILSLKNSGNHMINLDIYF